VFFFEKKNQKTFIRWAPRKATRGTLGGKGAEARVCGSFFKKEQFIVFVSRRASLGERTADDPPLYFDFHVFVCVNRRPDLHPKGSCAVRGSERLRDYMKLRAKQLGIARARINAAACLDRCELGPCIVVYPEGVWYHIDNETDVDEVLQTHLLGAGRVERLMLDTP
jgi:(2Fe-2S) ferredoxin